MARRYWLMKTEPSVFSFNDLLKAPKQTSNWEGVRNYQARNFMRDDFKVGDRVLIYHSSTDVPGVVGTAEVVREGYPDKTALDPKSKYFDEKAKAKGESPWVMVDVKAVAKFKTLVDRPMLAAEPKLKNMLVLKRGMRLSIQPITEAEYDTVSRLGTPVAVGKSSKPA